MCEIRIIDRNKTTTLTAESGARLSDILTDGGFFVDMPCGANGKCGKCALTVNGKKERVCRYIVNDDITVVLNNPENSVDGVCDEIPFDADKKYLCLALDLGTTTLALALVSTGDGKTVKTLSRSNSQRMFGADIMARIEFCRKNGVSKLQSAVINDINRLTALFNLKAPLPLYVAGNTTMLHIFFGVDCSCLGTAPYTPVFLHSKKARGASLGLNGVSEVISLPCISAFAGADIAAGLNFVPAPPSGRYNMLIDLGTNAEIAIFNGTSLFCTSAAAGPCFEGANISCGMSAVEGAVYSYKSGRAQVIGGGLARGICGTGLIDAVAFLLDEKIVDRTGFMSCGEYEIANGIYLSQEDIRQFQTAKSAVFSAIRVLMKSAGVTFDEIKTVYVSGGFSQGFNVESAVRTGLLPSQLGAKCLTAGNSSLQGTVKYACVGEKLPGFIDAAQYIDLAADAEFSKEFIANMGF